MRSTRCWARPRPLTPVRAAGRADRAGAGRQRAPGARADDDDHRRAPAHPCALNGPCCKVFLEGATVQTRLRLRRHGWARRLWLPASAAQTVLGRGGRHARRGGHRGRGQALRGRGRGDRAHHRAGQEGGGGVHGHPGGAVQGPVRAPATRQAARAASLRTPGAACSHALRGPLALTAWATGQRACGCCP